MATLNTAQVAEKLDTTPRELRKFLRASAKDAGTTDALPGKGKRYALEAKSVPALKKQYAEWVAARAAQVSTDEVAENEVTETE